jgi:hypothetical protein
MANHGHNFGPWSRPFKSQLGLVTNMKNEHNNKHYKMVKLVYLKTAYGTK